MANINLSQQRFLQPLRSAILSNYAAAKQALIDVAATIADNESTSLKADGSQIVARYYTDESKKIVKSIFGIYSDATKTITIYDADVDKISEIEGAIADVESAAKAAATKLTEKSDGHVTVTVEENTETGALTYTISENDIASAKALDAEVERAMGVEEENAAAIAAEETRAKGIESGLQSAIDKLNGAVTDEGSVAYDIAAAKTELLGDATEGYQTLGDLEEKIKGVSDAAKSYSIVKITDGLSTNVKEAFKLVDEDGTQAGEIINIYKDSSLKSVALNEQTLNFTYILADGSESTVGVDVSDFLAESEFGDGLVVSEAGVVSVALAESTEEDANYLKFEGEEGSKTLAVREIKTNDTVLQKAITVAGLSDQFGAGNYENNDVIPAGTDIYTILQNILCKELYAKPTSTQGTISASIANPTITLDKASTQEVGTLVTMNSASVAESTVSTTSSTVVGMTYGYSADDDDSVDSTSTSISKSWTTSATGSDYKMSASLSGFDADKTTNIQKTPASVSAREMAKTTLGCCAEGNNTITVSVTGDTFTGSIDGIGSVYHCSNLGNTDAAQKTTAVASISEKISNAPTSSASITVKAQYKYFLGYSENTAYNQFDSASVRALTTKTGWTAINDTTSIIGATSITSNGKSIVIACPSKYKLATITNGVGASILSNFSSVGKVNVTTGSIETEYMVYVYPITNGAAVEFKNVTLTKA